MSKPNPNPVYFTAPTNIRLTKREPIPLKLQDQSVTWPYVAGFFDGEGSINFSRVGTCNWVLVAKFCQTAGSHQVLVKIQRFLRKHRIASTFSTPNVRGHRKPLENLHVNSFGHCYRFLMFVAPYLIVKKDRAEESIRVLHQRYVLEDELKARLLAALKDYNYGYGLQEAATRNGLKGGHRLRHWMLKNGHKLRPFREALLARLAIRPKAVKSHCIRGHEMSGDNIAYYPHKRVCKACVKVRANARLCR
jgi:hypothetical protein